MTKRATLFVFSTIVLFLAGTLTYQIALPTVFAQERNEPDEDNGRTTLFVDAAASLGGDGTREHPFVRITDAVVRARALRQEEAIDIDRDQRQEDWDGRQKRIVIRVLPGTYVGSFTNMGPRIEALPIRLDVPRLTLLGSTSMERDEAGLPTGLIEPGSNTLLLADTPLVRDQVLILVASTGGEVVDRVTVAKLSLDTRAAGMLFGGDIEVDRAQDFTIRDNYITAAMRGGGLRTDQSSGRVLGNYVTRLGIGIEIHAGNPSSPATVLVSRNRSVKNLNGGLSLIGTSGPTASPENSLSAVVSGNDLSDNTATPDFSFGLRCFVLIGIPGQTSGAVTATISNNTIRNNNFGVLMDAGFAYRTDPQLYTGTFDFTFDDDEIVGNIRASALISFTRFSASLHPIAELSVMKYLERSIFDIKYSNGELDGYWFDHPEVEPIDGRTLNNVLRVNGEEIPSGRFIPFP